MNSSIILRQGVSIVSHLRRRTRSRGEDASVITPVLFSA